MKTLQENRAAQREEVTLEVNAVHLTPDPSPQAARAPMRRGPSTERAG